MTSRGQAGGFPPSHRCYCFLTNKCLLRTQQSPRSQITNRPCSASARLPFRGVLFGGCDFWGSATEHFSAPPQERCWLPPAKHTQLLAWPGIRSYPPPPPVSSLAGGTLQSSVSSAQLGSSLVLGFGATGRLSCTNRITTPWLDTLLSGAALPFPPCKLRLGGLEHTSWN